jgi:hypothetical protein
MLIITQVFALIFYFQHVNVVRDCFFLSILSSFFFIVAITMVIVIIIITSAISWLVVSWLDRV